MPRILVIEDNPDNLELMTYLLDAFGHDVATATDGEQAVETISALTFDLIVCDVHLPKMDGYEIVKFVKARADLGHVPIIAVTALAMVGDRERLLSAGFDGYVSKPIEPEAFGQVIERYLPPVSPDAVRRMAAAAPAQEAAEKGVMPKAIARLLVIDDIAENRDLLEATLAPQGYEVILCGSAAEALAAASRQAFDLVLSDLRMPDQDGLDLLRAFKNNPELSDLPFLIITASRWTDKEREHARRLGAVAFLTKPVEPRDLIARISACIRNKVEH